MGQFTVIGFDGVINLEVAEEVEAVVAALKATITNTCIVPSKKDDVYFKNFHSFGGFIADIIPLLKERLTSKSFDRRPLPNGEIPSPYTPTFWIKPYSSESADIEVSVGEDIPMTMFKNVRRRSREAELRGARNIKVAYQEYVKVGEGDEDWELQPKTFLAVDDVLAFKAKFRRRYDEVNLLDADYYKRGNNPFNRYSISANKRCLDASYSILRAQKRYHGAQKFAKVLLSLYKFGFRVDIINGRDFQAFKLHLSNRKKPERIQTILTRLGVMETVNSMLSKKKISRLSQITTNRIIVGTNRASLYFVFEQGALTEAKMQKALQALFLKVAKKKRNER